MTSAAVSAQQRREDAAILREAHEWRLLLEDGQATEAERAAFEAWRDASPRHSDLYDYAVAFAHALGELQPRDIPEDLLEPSPMERVRVGFRGQFAAVAAGLGPARARFALASTAALLLAAVLWTSNQPAPPADVSAPFSARYATAIGEVRAIALPDGSQLTLGAASAVAIDFSADQRSARLEAGEAFFHVESESSRVFIVRAGDLDATVVGTQFDVRLSNDTVRVAVAEGEVRVAYPQVLTSGVTDLKTERRLSASKQVLASTEEGLQPVEPANVSAIGAWRDDKLFYEGARLTELIEDANRYTDARVVIDGDRAAVAALRVRGSFNARDVDGILSALAEIYPLDVDRSTAGVVRISPRRSTD